MTATNETQGNDTKDLLTLYSRAVSQAYEFERLAEDTNEQAARLLVIIEKDLQTYPEGIHTITDSRGIVWEFMIEDGVCMGVDIKSDCHQDTSLLHLLS